jgi:ribonuclease III
MPTPLEERLGYVFNDPLLLRLALTHPSCRHESGHQAGDNQRMEFLGDAVLQMVLTDALYHRFPRWDEGRLTRLRARLVNRNALELLAVRYDLGAELILGKGEHKNQGRSRSSNLADAFEAVSGAIFLDAGYEVAAAWVRGCFQPVIDSESAAPDDFNAKGALQEWLQSEGKTTPTYILISESGPDHAKTYTIAALSETVEIGRGTGASKKAAESLAAAAALENLKNAKG